PYTIQEATPGDWHYPLVDVNGTNYSYYLDADGTRSTVTISHPSAGVYSPDVVNTALVYWNTTTNTYYTYPENLAHIEDFVAAWKPSWAQSLVQYHPEYCYYQTCHEYSRKQITSDNMTSDQFDNLLRGTNTFADAVSAGFIKSSYASFPDPNDRLEDWFTLSTSHPYDPFVTNTSTFGNYSTVLQHTFDDYISYDTSTYSMLEAASMSVRCGLNYGVLPGNSCMQFGSDYVTGGPTSVNDSIRDLEWNTFKSLYLSAKLRIQNDRSDSLALHDCNTLNDCIGEGDDFNPINAGMLNFSWMSWSGSEYYNNGEPCSVYNFMLYAGKQKRFPDAENYQNISPSDAAYQQYLQTGQCPEARALQDLTGAIFASDSMTEDSVRLMSFMQYNGFYMAKHDYAPQYPISTEAYWWNGSVDGDTLNVVWTNPNASGDTVCSMLFDKHLTSITNWTDIVGFKDLQASAFDGTNYSFTALALLPPVVTGDPYSYQEISGSTSCVDILNCKFPVSCPPSGFAKDIQLLMTALAANGDLSDSALNLETSTYLPFVTPRIRSQVGSPSDSLTWTLDTANDIFILRRINATSNWVELKVINATPSGVSYDSIESFANIMGEDHNSFEMDGIDSTGATIVHLELVADWLTSADTEAISMGTCGHPTPVACDEREHHVRTDLETLLASVLLQKPFTDDTDLFRTTAMTALLRSYLPPSDSATDAVYVQDTVSGIHYDTLTYSIPGCHLQLAHSDTLNPAMPLDSLIDLYGLTGYGTPDAQGNYYDFTLTAVYKIGSDTISDTLFGSSCWPLKNCTACPTPPEEEEEESLSLFSPSGGSPTPDGGGLSCEGWYAVYIQTLKDYNDSDYAAWSGVYLDTALYYDFPSFARAELCGCVESYIDYLQAYLADTADTTLAIPVDIDHYTGCRQNVLALDDPCKDAYADYITAVYKYNTFVYENPGLGFDSLALEYSYTRFTSDSLCYCVGEFVSLVNEITDGRYNDNPDTAQSMLHFANYCEAYLAVPCTNTAVLDTFVSPPASYSNPCVEYKINTALANAQLAYDDYIDSLTNAIANEYRSHCMQAVENFTDTYTEKEYHFTLYYYDQAGNLVKTVPPEGVEPLDIDSSGD
ncbi:MAG TPA: hypothetical protein VFU15_04385, partial [Bacteroidia bacterium]|nr:hypothetical protein [Bacteroidia bacterium]